MCSIWLVVTNNGWPCLVLFLSFVHGPNTQTLIIAHTIFLSAPTGSPCCYPPLMAKSVSSLTGRCYKVCQLPRLPVPSRAPRDHKDRCSVAAWALKSISVITNFVQTVAPWLVEWLSMTGNGFCGSKGMPTWSNTCIWLLVDSMEYRPKSRHHPCEILLFPIMNKSPHVWIGWAST